MFSHPATSSFFFFNDTATTEIYTLSLHDALPISPSARIFWRRGSRMWNTRPRSPGCGEGAPDRKSTGLNSSHLVISYAVFCLKKKKKMKLDQQNKEQALDDLVADSKRVRTATHAR